MDKLYDSTIEVRKGEELNAKSLQSYLNSKLDGFNSKISIKQFPGGFSNLTYLISDGNSEFVLRKPPLRANIKTAHDMSREFKVLSLLKPVYSQVPTPILFCKDTSILGAPFYLMQRVEGLILRKKVPKGMDFNNQTFKKLSQITLDNLAKLHDLELTKSQLITLGKPKGYVKRQVDGWTKRYFKAETDQIKAMNFAAEWMRSEMPNSQKIGFIHNDYKYDNLVLDQTSLKIKAVLDWEMSTVGDPLMDLGTALSYWVEKDEHPLLREFNLTWIEGNLDRQEIIERYAVLQKVDLDHILFYYVFGCFKLAVIVQQIYARYKKGYTKDERFANLIYLVKASAKNAENAIRFNRINKFY